MEGPRGRVLSLHRETEPARALVEIRAALRCARCAAGKGCGAGALGGDGKLQRVDALIAGGVDVSEGDEVRVELAPNNVLAAASIVYGLPLAGAVTGAGVAWGWGAGDAWAVLAACAGAAVGIAVGRLRLRRADCLRRFTPVVTARLAGAGG